MNKFYTGFKVMPHGRNCSLVHEYYLGDLWKAWIVPAPYHGGNVMQFVEEYDSIEQFVLDFDTLGKYALFR